MKKLLAYKKAESELAVLLEKRVALTEELGKTRVIQISSTLSITENSSDSQYVFAIGVLNSQINSAWELGIEGKDYLEKKASVLQFRKLAEEKKELDKHYNDLYRYKCEVYELLTKTELFALKVYPKR